MVLYAVARFVIEFFRGDAARGTVFGGALSTSQFIAILMVLGARCSLASLRVQEAPRDAAARPAPA